MKVRLSKYFNCFYYEHRSFFIAELKLEAEEMSPDEYKQEILSNLELLKKYKPKYYIYDASIIFYNPVGPDIQEWLAQNSFRVTNHFIKKEAIIISNSLVMQTSAKQTLEEDESENAIRKVFTSRKEAEKWLFEQ